ncbi:hypothetical protein FQN51_002671 [Onygenales sp. PD_10]|nr:hypothetical protein FQN51_002671 [Onygenales sp. PD_10]
MKFLAAVLAVLPILAVNAAPAPDSHLAARDGCAAMVTASALKCRTGPGTKYTAVRQYPKNRVLFFRCQDYGEMGTTWEIL